MVSSPATIAASTIWYVDSPDALAGLHNHEPDADAAQALAGQLHPGEQIIAVGPGTLASPVAELLIGCYPGLTVAAAPDFTLPKPSQLDTQLIRPLAYDQTYLVALDTKHGWGGFAQWERGVLRRAFSATRVNILEDEGLPLVWERPFWAGERPIEDQFSLANALPFDPPALADAANEHWLGFSYLGGGATIHVNGFQLSPQGPSSPSHAHSGLFRKWLRRRQTT